ncbi:ATP-binding cassette subfamily C protein CydC [Rhodococcus sp. LBL1]|nr:ATP-binding cassette subfamily C protein CydC [Rhodococcus sp. LBL1]MDH6683048.1 ATP-binding cassette subfamily C protein CydC [Rhodococcus sp. LBL2]
MTRWLLTFGRPVLWPLAISAVCRIAGLGAGIALFGYAARAIGVATTGGAAQPTTVFAVVVALAAVKGMFGYLEQYTGHWVAFRALAMLRVFLYDRLAALAPAVMVRHRTGDLLARVTRDIDRLEVFFAHSVVPAVAAVLVPSGVLVFLAVAVAPAVALVVAPFLVVLGAVIPFLGRRSAHDAATGAVRIGGLTSAHLTDTIGGLREIAAYRAGDHRRAALADLDTDAAARHRVVAQWVGLRAAVTRATQAGVLLAVVVVGRTVGLDVATLAMAVGLVAATFPALEAVDGFAALLDSTRESLARVRAVAEEAPATVDPAPDQARTPARSAPEIRVHSVDFTHPAEATRPAVLTGVDLTLAAGSTVGLIGATGSGKSTLGALLARVWDPSRGAVTWDGVDLRRIPLAELRSLITVIDQHPFLVRGTVADNLRLADPDVSEDRMWHALDVADLAETVAALPQGLHTRVGEGGTALSGGQRQRLAIARAVMHGGRLVIVDEGTSQLDADTERRVLDRLGREFADRTVLWITHRPGTLDACDEVVRLDRGRITREEVTGATPRRARG